MFLALLYLCRVQRRMLPVTLLLDKTGRLVTTDINHGEGDKLENDVRGLLGLPPLTKAHQLESDEADDPFSVESSK